MATEEKWYFTKEQLDNTPSRQCGIDALFYRQQAANFIQDMGQRLRVSQLCINTATVYMHRFYVFHSFTHFPWHSIAAAALFLSAKVEEQPRKLEHVIRVHNICKNPKDLAFDVTSERYQSQSQDLVFNENVLLQTLGFDVAIDHPHVHVVRCCHLVRASKDLAQTSYFMASTSLHLTTMCLQYKPTVVACFCIHLACKWSNWEIPLSNEKREWFSYVDQSVTAELLQQLTEEFLVIFEMCPSRLKEKIMAIGDGPSMSRSTTHSSSPFESEPRKLHPPTDIKDPHHRLHHHEKAGKLGEDPHKHRTSSRPPHESSSSSQQQREREYREYREKKERETIAQHSGSKRVPHTNPSSKQPSAPHGHHRPPVDQKMKPHSRPQSMGPPPVVPRKTTRDICMRDSYRGEATDSNKETQSSRDGQVRSDKDVEKRAYPVKTSANDKNNLNNLNPDHINFSGDNRPEISRSSRVMQDPKLMQVKHEPGRRHDEQKPQHENDVRKHLTGWYDNKNMYDKSSSHVKQPTNSTSQKMKSPFTSDASKSVPKTSIKTEPHNGSSNGGYGLPLLDVKDVKLEVKEEPTHYQMPVKKPSMFSPEKTPPRKQSSKRSSMETTLQNIPPPISPLLDPEKRSRTTSNSSEPELRPVMKKIDQVEGFENILRDSTIGINKHQVSDSDVALQLSIMKDLKTPDLIPPFSSSSGSSSTHSVILSQPLVNGIETNPTLISNLLKETPSVPHLPTIANSVNEEATSANPVTDTKEKEHHHKDRKKKSKEKHKHKDKDKEKHREDKEKKKKHKDKDKHKSKSRDKDKQEELPPLPMMPTPIKITISKDKITAPEPPPTIGLKIKIPKDRIKTDVIGESSMHLPNPGIKIKIPKDVITNLHTDSKKRERDRSTPSDAPPSKQSKSNYRQHGDKQNGRSSYSKVAHMGDGDTSMHRLAESKYINKGAST